MRVVTRRFKPLAGIHSSATCCNFSFAGSVLHRFKPLAGIHSSATYDDRSSQRRYFYGFKPLAGIHSSATQRHQLPAGTEQKFQTPRGNSLLCNRLVTLVRANVNERFKPLAGIHSSATRSFVLGSYYQRDRFKPLAGIHSSATLFVGLPTLLGIMFQTPRGNSLLCNSSRRTSTTDMPYSFQTPRGNSLLCNAH